MKSYLTHDNYGRPFMVNITGKNVDVYIEIQKASGKSVYDLLKKYKNVSKIFIGKDSKYGFIGNSILLRLNHSKNKYAFIGHDVYEFTAPEPITQYYSLVGNNDVPYPVATSKNYAYFMLEPSVSASENIGVGGEYVSKALFPRGFNNWEGAYSIYYQLFPEWFFSQRKFPAYRFKDVKLIVYRIY